MVAGTLSLVQKGQTSGYSGIVVYGGGDAVVVETLSLRMQEVL